MKASTLRLICALLLFAALYTSCTLPLPDCTPADLISPVGTYPSWETISTFTPTLSWDFSPECEPDHFLVEWHVVFGSRESATSPGDSTTFAVPAPLAPTTEYLWKVAAVTDGVEGPFSDSETFWTGPVCTYADLFAPVAVSPLNFGVQTNAAFQALVWEYPADASCLPEYYVAELRPAEDTAFTGPNLMDEPSSDPPATRQVPMALLDDCSGFIWRVKAVAAHTDGPWSEYYRFHTDYSGACSEESYFDFYPTCPTADLASPITIYPDTYDIVPDLIPSFSWSYPDLCFPEGYRIDVTTYGDYSEGTISERTGNPSTSWPPASPLEPATKYEWRVAPINETTLGPYSYSIRFMTGPICTTADLVAPVLDIPENAHEAHTLTPMFSWDYPDVCVPESYEWYLSLDHSFSTWDDFVDLGIPADTIILADEISNCTIYFWRVRAKNHDGAGPFSDIFNFYTNFDDTCPTVAPPPAETVCPAGQRVNPTTGECVPIPCSSATNESTCESYPHCDWDPKGAQCTE